MASRSSVSPLVGVALLVLAAVGAAYYVPLKQSAAAAGVPVAVSVPVLLIALLACAFAGGRVLRRAARRAR